MKNISGKYKYLLEQDKAVDMEGATFRIYKDRSFLGKRILESLNAKRDGVRADGHHGFYLSDENKDVGLMSQLFGASGLFALINRYNAMDEVYREGSQTDKLLQGISRTVVDVLDYVEVNGYDMNPYIDKATNDELFVSDPDNHYVGAMTWALSLFTAAVRALRDKTFKFRFDNDSDDTHRDADEAEVEKLKLRLYKQIKYIITYFVDNYIDHGKGFGWGYCRGCEEPSLFFTYSVIEAYSDFEDNVMPIDDDSAEKTEWDNDLLNFLNADLKEGEKRLEQRYRELCYKVGDKTWALYKNYLRTQFFSERFNGTVTTVTESEIRNTSRSTALFNTLYIIFILFYSSTNIRKTRYDGGNDRTDEELQEVVNTMTRGLQLVQNFYSDLKSERLDSIVDKHILSFTQKNSLIPDFAKLIGDFTIQASPLLPMLVKANNLIAYWVLKFPQQTMTELFDEVLEAKNDDAWLWEKKRYDLLSTERYLEAIADYFDYYDTYERSYAAKVSNAAQLRQEISKKLEAKSKETLEKQIAKNEKENEDRLKKERDRLRTEVRTEVEHSIRSEYLIEPQIEKKIAAMFESKAEEFYQSYFIGRLTKIAEYNRLDGKAKAAAELPAEVAALKSVIEDYVRSYFANAFKDANITWEDVGSEKFEKATLSDFNDFVMKYMGFAAENADRVGNTLHLSKIFDIIRESKSKKIDFKKDE